MGLIKRPGSDYWYIEFIHNGRRFKVSSGTNKKAEARAIEATMRADLAAGSDLASLPKVTLGEAITRYIDGVIKPKNNAKALSANGYLLGRLKRDLGASVLLADLTASRIASYRDCVERISSACRSRCRGHLQPLPGRIVGDWDDGIGDTPMRLLDTRLSLLCRPTTPTGIFTLNPPGTCRHCTERTG
jgi:hypothetical protein